MDKTITRTKALQDLSDKCNATKRCRDCKLHRFCSIRYFTISTDEELEQIYDLMFNKKVKIVDFVEAKNSNNFTVRLDNLSAKDFEKAMGGIKVGQLENVSYDINNEVDNDVDVDKTNPNYYKSECSLECIEAMLIAFGSDKVYDFCICNAFKYMWRYKNKNGFEDVKKARWYVDKAKELGFDEPEVFNIEFILEKIESEGLS